VINTTDRVVLVVMVSFIQFGGDRLAQRLNER